MPLAQVHLSVAGPRALLVMWSTGKAKVRALPIMQLSFGRLLFIGWLLFIGTGSCQVLTGIIKE